MKALLDYRPRHKAGSACGHLLGVLLAPAGHRGGTARGARAAASRALIEATSNQVNQFGGYTRHDARRLPRLRGRHRARASALPPERLLLGGDHLGPNCWRAEPAAAAPWRAREQLIADYVAAGFRKIHLDCSMACADDPAPLADAVIAARAARLCQVAEAAWRTCGGEPPVYVIGTEVPTPGGAAEDARRAGGHQPGGGDRHARGASQRIGGARA